MWIKPVARGGGRFDEVGGRKARLLTEIAQLQGIFACERGAGVFYHLAARRTIAIVLTVRGSLACAAGMGFGSLACAAGLYRGPWLK